jgi:APA family basic amino acid/polyamine antiporter
VPRAGSAYTYSKTAFGNLIGFVVGWCLLAEYLFTISAVSVGWAGYFNSMLAQIGLAVPKVVSAGPFVFNEATQDISFNPETVVNLCAVLLIVTVSAVLCVGVRKSQLVTTVAVSIKMVVIITFVTFGIWYVKWENLTPFIPPEDTERGFGHYGWSGVLRGASVVFFAYIGFDSVTAAAAETQDPATMMPIGIFSSLGISTSIYMLVSFVMVGLADYHLLGVADPVIVAVEQAGPGLAWLKPLITIGVVCGLPGVVLVAVYATSRVVLLMAQDGMLPEVFGDINATFNTPIVATVCCGVISSVIAGLFPIGVLAELTSMGTLVAFALVCGGVVMLRHTQPDLPRPFKVPFSPYLPLLGVFLALVQIGTIVCAAVSVFVCLFCCRCLSCRVSRARPCALSDLTR